ncbi:unnamed protein product [Trichobilharzia szidati]|nr:unnamed protein product [Trichobilharzia szidati]
MPVAFSSSNETMAGELMLGDFFPDFTTNDFCSTQPSQLWMSEIFETLDEQHVMNEDMLAENSPDGMKTKLEAPLSDILNGEDDFFVGDEVEISESTPLGSILLDDTANSDESSGYASCVQSSKSASPNPPRLKTIPSRHSAVRVVSPPNTVSLTNSPRKIHVTRIDPPKFGTHTVQAVIHKTPPKTLDVKANRVHFILRPFSAESSSVSLSSDAVNSQQKTSTPQKISYLNEGSRVANSEDIYELMHNTKQEALYDHNEVLQSSTSIGSHSSSESDSRDNFDDEMTCQEFYLDHENITTSSPKLLASHLNFDLTSHSEDISSAKGLSRLSEIDSLIYSDSPLNEYRKSNKVAQQHFFHDQLHSRMRGPTRIGRSEINHPHMLVLTEEEKRTLIAEGYSIPTRLPLSKQDERNLKKVRRKIKNKISAQESRRKKKEYLEALERKVSIYSQENIDLKRRVDGLESTNRSLLGQLRLLQQLVSKSKLNNASGSSNSTDLHKTSHQNRLTTNSSGNSDSVHGINHSNGSPSTCLMVFALCFAALLIGQPSGNENQSSLNSGLSYTLSSQNSFNSWMSQVPQRLVSSSLSQLGYDLSKQSRSAIYTHDPHNKNTLMDAYTTQSISDHLPSGYSSHSNSHHHSHPPPFTQKPQVQRSRLLGEASELEDCAPVQSFWSYLFGNPTSTRNQVCGRNTDSFKNELHLIDAMEQSLLMTSSNNETGRSDYSRYNKTKNSLQFIWPPVIESL